MLRIRIFSHKNSPHICKCVEELVVGRERQSHAKNLHGVWKSKGRFCRAIDLLAILQKSLDRAIFLYNFILQVR